MYKLVMRGEGGQKEEFRKRMEVGQATLGALLLNCVKAIRRRNQVTTIKRKLVLSDLSIIIYI